MKYQLECDHYIDDKILPIGTIIGDGTEVLFRDAKGNPTPPSTSMIPMDAEAKKIFEAKFGIEPPERDPLKAIPIQGTAVHQEVKSAPYSPRPGSTK